MAEIAQKPVAPEETPVVPQRYKLTFFMLVTCFVLWGLIRRYRVSTFADCMVVTPFLGSPVWVRYDQIERLEWAGLRMESGFRSLEVQFDGGRRVRLHGIVDVEQIILTIDRFDLLPRTL